jgi:hypothetical protein
MCTPLQIYIKMGFRHLFKIITYIMLIKAFNIIGPRSVRPIR